MIRRPEGPKNEVPPGSPPPSPDVDPQLIPVPEIKKDTPLPVIEGALEELRRKEKDERENEGNGKKPTVH